MRFLLISDTHGDLGVINDLAGHVQLTRVIHAGDFGFYDDGSYERLSERELRLHSDIPICPAPTRNGSWNCPGKGKFRRGENTDVETF